MSWRLQRANAGHEACCLAGMHRAAALVAEEDRDLRALIGSALQRAGFGVLEAATPAQVKQELGWLAARGAGTTLLLLSESIAVSPAVAFATSLGARMRRCGRVVAFVFMKDLGSDFAPPSVRPCDLVMLLEKPFDLDRLQTLCAAILEPSGVTAQVSLRRAM